MPGRLSAALLKAAPVAASGTNNAVQAGATLAPWLTTMPATTQPTTAKGRKPTKAMRNRFQKALGQTLSTGIVPVDDSRGGWRGTNRQQQGVNETWPHNEAPLVGGNEAGDQADHPSL